MPELLHQTNINRFNLFGAIVSLMYYHLSRIIKGLKERVIELQSKSSGFHIIPKNKESMTPQWNTAK